MSETTTLEDLKGAMEGTGATAPAPDANAAPTEPKLDKFGRAYATGKRKNAVARVWIKPGSGRIKINGRDLEVYFARPVLRMILNQPLVVTAREKQFDITATVVGGGLSCCVLIDCWVGGGRAGLCAGCLPDGFLVVAGCDD